ncbi:acyl-homoserine-lactone synthase [Pararhodospirillum photometricum]|uniref:Acyl-homoserine-lactone synthase n=1 Tax=Pararhodospirillum photometricum DSM 122 TaxID=1150469 RepID=H6SLL0_PARPM|nr:acyl-homoserine-lactone synthase [Pararhodospirillum photometricum]CCG08875.1 Autoinducer synthesis protein [Pararhodospirillum photometricum DSM 122]
MFTITDQYNAIANAWLIHSFSELRYEIFINRLKWPLACPVGREVDQFDDQDAVYLTSTNRRGQVVAGARLLSTARRSLLNEAFAGLVDGPLPCDDLIVDVTRFAVDHRPERVEGCGNLCGQLLVALQEYGLALGLKHYVSVSDVRMEPILRRGGFRFQRLGGEVSMDGTGVVALTVEISPERLAAAQARAQVHTSMLAWEPLRRAA